MTHTPYDYQRKAYADVLSAFDEGHRAVDFVSNKV